MPQVGQVVDMRKFKGPPRIKREDVLRVIEEKRGMTRDQLAKHFECSPLTIETHIVNLKSRELIVVGAWVEPQRTGQWSPVWVKKTLRDQVSLPRPLAKEHKPKRRADDDNERDERVVQLGAGVKQEHAVMARARALILHRNDKFDVGVWGGLVGSRCKWGATSDEAAPQGGAATCATAACLSPLTR